MYGPGEVSKDILTCTECYPENPSISVNTVWVPSLDFTCRICAGLAPFMEACQNCNIANQLYDQATKKCINCSVPGIASMDKSGWTLTTYPVETCKPCDATKNEYAKGNESPKSGYTCTTCEGTIGLSS